MTRILGIDPGLQKTGWGMIEAQGNYVKYIACGTIYTPAKEPIDSRLKVLHDGLSQVIGSYRPVTGGIEQTFVNKNPLSSLKLGHARGALMLTARLSGICLTEYPANTIKKSLVGAGHAQKEQVMVMVKQLLPGAIIETEDAADALAVAICHIHHVEYSKRIATKVKVQA